MKYLLPFDDFLMRAGFLKISQRKSSNEGIQMNLIVDMDDCKDAFKVFDPENTGTICSERREYLHFEIIFPKSIIYVGFDQFRLFFYEIPAAI